ncbi:MAG: hypothetical protein ACM35E_06920 [Deltaproteobacteria bacterium]|jgi:hypothetical protein
MLRILIGATLIALLSLAQFNTALYAQQAQQASVPAEIRMNIIGTIGAKPETVEIAQVGNIITVLRINSYMNESTHGGRDNEANAIAPIVAKDISGNEKSKNVNTIRVQYVIRSASGTTNKIIDTIDFRKSPSGNFELHKT